MGEPGDDSDRQDVDNEISGNVYGSAGQFGNVYGDVHIYGPSPTPRPPSSEPSKRDAAAESSERKKQDRAEDERKRRAEAERARYQRREEDKKAIKGCGLLVLLLGVSGFVALGIYSHEWVTAGVLAGVVAILLFLWGAGMAMHDD